MWAAGIAAAAVLALTGYALLGGGDDSSSEGRQGGAGSTPSASASASPSATYQAPKDWTEPAQWVALYFK